MKPQLAGPRKETDAIKHRKKSQMPPKGEKPKGEKEKDRKEEEEPTEPIEPTKPTKATEKKETAQRKKNDAKEENNSDNEVEFLYEVKSTYKREGIIRRRQLKLETEMKAKEKWLTSANQRPRDGYMRWEEMLRLYGPMESDSEETDTDLEEACDAKGYKKEDKQPRNGTT